MYENNVSDSGNQDWKKKIDDSISYGFKQLSV